MSPPPKLISEVPNVENSIPIAVYQVSSPEKFDLDDDKFVIYGGGPSFRVEISPNDPSYTLNIDSKLQGDWNNVSLYVLNTSFIVWLNTSGVGVELPYQSILLHAVKEVENGTQLLLHVFSSELLGSIPNEQTEFTPTVELRITENPGGPFAGSNPIFTQVNSSIESVFSALSQCSALHYDTDEEDQDTPLNTFDNPQVEVPQAWISETLLDTSGNADDLEEIEEDQNPEHEAAMYVDVGYASIAGSVRKRDVESGAAAKNRRLN